MNTFDEATNWRYLGNNIYMKDMQSWTKNDYAGEGLYKKGNDSSGCLRKDTELCNPPRSTIVRAYKNDKTMIFSTLRYPNAFGFESGYLWEVEYDEFPKFEKETEMENYIMNVFSQLESNNIGKLVEDDK